MKKKLKQILKLFTTLLVIVVTACQNDFEEQIAKQSSSSQISSEKRTVEAVLNEIKNPLVKDFIIKNRVPIPNFLNRNSENNNEDYAEFDLFIKPNEYDTYTLLVEDYSPQNPYFKYVIVQKQGEIERAGFAKYIPNYAQSELNLKEFDGLIQFYDTNNSLKAESVLINGIAQPNIQQKNKNSSRSTICTDEFVTIVHNCTHGGEHPPGTFCDNGSPSNGYYEYFVVTTCEEDYDTHTFIENPEAFIVGGGGGQEPPQPTTNPNPCEAITQKINNPDINSKIVNFNTPSVLNLNYEKGFDFVENADGNLSYNPIDGNPGQTGIDFKIDANGNTIGFIHSHFDKPNMSPIFTIEDIKSFNAIDIFRSTRGKTRTNTCLMLVSRAGVFALVIEDFTLMKNYGDKLHDPEDFEELKKEYNGRTSTMLTDDDVIKQVLKILPKYGVGLYKANDNLDGWNKLSYNPNSNSIIPIPCN